MPITYKLGSYAAGTVTAIGIAYFVALVVGFLQVGFDAPIADPVLVIMEVLTILSALALLVTMAVVHQQAAPDEKSYPCSPWSSQRCSPASPVSFILLNWPHPVSWDQVQSSGPLPLTPLNLWPGIGSSAGDWFSQHRHFLQPARNGLSDEHFCWVACWLSQESSGRWLAIYGCRGLVFSDTPWCYPSPACYCPVSFGFKAHP